MDAAAKQAVGSGYVLDSMKLARDKTWDAVNRFASSVRPGMLESEATAGCRQLLTELGMDRIWHPVLVRFGENTLKKFNQRSEVDPRLEDNDIFFIDLGVVWNAHEGDAGATFVVGEDADEGVRRCRENRVRRGRTALAHDRRGR